MPNNKDNPKGGSQSAKGNKPDREFEGQAPNKGFGGDQSKQAAKSGKVSPGSTEDDEMKTSGGRQGQFSDKERGKDDQWSPGSDQSPDQ